MIVFHNIVVMLAKNSSGEVESPYAFKTQRIGRQYGLVSVAMNLFKLMTVEWRVIMIFY